MKKKVPFVAIFAVGVIVGVVISQHIPVHTSRIGGEEETRKRMHDFQVSLDQLEKTRPDSVEALSKQIEAQQGIEDLLTKYREAEQAKWAPYVGPGEALLAVIITGIVTWVAARRTSKSTPDTQRP